MKVLRSLTLTTSAILAVAAATVVAAAPAAAKRAAPLQGVGYAGETAQDLPMSLVLTANRKAIKRLDIMWIALPGQCSTLMPYVSATTFGADNTKAIALSSGKRFRHTFVDALTLPEVGSIEEHPVVRGTVGRTRAFGTFRATAVVKDAAGAEVTRCDTGTISWTAVQ